MTRPIETAALEQTAQALMAFAYPSPARLMRCAALHERIAELAVTYPLILLILASGWGPAASRRKAIRLIVQGRRLNEIADALALPMCFRRIAPEALRCKPPYACFPPQASKKLSPFVPDEPDAAARWLPLVAMAQRLGGIEFATWIARHGLLIEPEPIQTAWLRPLALYVWHGTSTPCETVPAHLRSLVPRSWTPRNALKSTIVDARIWLNRVKLAAFFTLFGVIDPWLERGEFPPYAIEPLIYPDDILEHAVDMGNCIDSYAERLANDFCRLFRVTHQGQSIATVEIARGCTFNMPSMGQIKGPANVEISAEIARVVMKWFLPHSSRGIPPPTPRNTNHETQTLRRLLAPSIAASQASRDPWFARPCWQELDSELSDLARHLDIRHWAFSQL